MPLCHPWGGDSLKVICFLLQEAWYFSYELMTIPLNDSSHESDLSDFLWMVQAGSLSVLWCCESCTEVCRGTKKAQFKEREHCLLVCNLYSQVLPGKWDFDGADALSLKRNSDFKSPLPGFGDLCCAKAGNHCGCSIHQKGAWTSVSSLSRQWHETAPSSSEDLLGTSFLPGGGRKFHVWET